MSQKVARDLVDAPLRDEKLQQVVGLLIEAARPRRIILIGSHARGPILQERVDRVRVSSRNEVVNRHLKSRDD
jgi:hypothetical protein